MNRPDARSLRPRLHAPCAALAALLLLSAVPAPAQQQDAASPPDKGGGSGAGPAITERLLLAVPNGWRNGTSSTSPIAVMTKLLPPGQTMENWTEMLTIQVIADPRSDARAAVNRIAEASRTGCDVSAPSPISGGLLNNYAVATMTVTCNHGHQSGKGGLVAVKAIRGRQALFVVERLWRGPAFEADEPVPVSGELLREWSSFLRSVSLCDEADPRHHPCPQTLEGRVAP